MIVSFRIDAVVWPFFGRADIREFVQIFDELGFGFCLSLSSLGGRVGFWWQHV